MDEPSLANFGANVRHRLRHFIWDTRNRKLARSEALRRIMGRGWRSCLFGGVVRDIVVKSPWVETRDIDIVVADVSVDELRDAFQDVLVRQTRFGGLTLNIQGWLFDIWPLNTTWGFKYFPLFANSFELLPKTTFFSVEAIAVELSTTSGVPRTIYQHRFMESVKARTIMLNLAENPYPELCIVRAFALARKLDFSLDASLVRHLARWAKRIPLRNVEKAMLSHYGRASFASDELKFLVRMLREHADYGKDEPLNVFRPAQLELPFMLPEPVDHFLANSIADVSSAAKSDCTSRPASAGNLMRFRKSLGDEV